MTPDHEVVVVADAIACDLLGHDAPPPSELVGQQRYVSGVPLSMRRFDMMVYYNCHRCNRPLIWRNDHWTAR